VNDIAGYQAVYRQPIKGTYRGHTIYGFPPPSSGGPAIQQICNYLEAFDQVKSGPMSTESFHRFVDAQNLAFADRNKYVGDGDFVDVPLEGLMDKGYMRSRRNSLTGSFAAIPTPIAPGEPEGVTQDFGITFDDHEVGTTHWSIVDRFGNAISFTSTIEQIMGSAVVVPGRGFLLNNELTDFEEFESDSTGAKYANAPEGGKKLRRTALGADANTYGGKRPRSSMGPLLVFNNTDDSLYLSTGSPGGSSIIGAVANVLFNVIDYKLDLQTATDYGRILAKNGDISAEREIYEAEEGGLYASLVARGFNFSSPVPTTATFGIVQSVMSTREGLYIGVADVKRESNALADGF